MIGATLIRGASQKVCERNCSGDRTSGSNKKIQHPEAVISLYSDSKQGTIVVAEDDNATRSLLTQILTKSNFNVIAVSNGKLACEAARRERPDVILLDWMMPVMDGKAAAEELKLNSETRGIPIVMLTTQSEIDERVVALEAGVQDFLSKPFHPRELVARIEQQMRWRKLLAVDANEPFLGDRLALYTGSKVNSNSKTRSDEAFSFIDPLAEPQRGKRRAW